MECPTTRVVGVECDPDAAHHWRDEYGVADGPVNLPDVYRDDLERVAVQMNRMRHHRVVDDLDLNALPFVQHQWADSRPIFAVHRPCIGFYSTVEDDAPDNVCRA